MRTTGTRTSPSVARISYLASAILIAPPSARKSEHALPSKNKVFCLYFYGISEPLNVSDISLTHALTDVVLDCDAGRCDVTERTSSGREQVDVNHCDVVFLRLLCDRNYELFLAFAVLEGQLRVR